MPTIAEQILADSCANGFECIVQNEGSFREAALQLAYEISGSTQTPAEVAAAACADGFECIGGSPLLFNKAALELAYQSI